MAYSLRWLFLLWIGYEENSMVMESLFLFHLKKKKKFKDKHPKAGLGSHMTVKTQLLLLFFCFIILWTLISFSKWQEATGFPAITPTFQLETLGKAKSTALKCHLKVLSTTFHLYFIGQGLGTWSYLTSKETERYSFWTMHIAAQINIKVLVFS